MTELLRRFKRRWRPHPANDTIVTKGSNVVSTSLSNRANNTGRNKSFDQGSQQSHPEATTTASGVSLGQTQTNSGVFTTSGTATRNLWDEAFQKLSEDEKAALGSPTTHIDDLVALTQKKRDECDDKRWKFEINGKQIVLRDLAEKAIKWINKYKDIGDLAASVDRVYAARAWAGFKVLLQFVTADIEQMAVLLVSMEIVSCLIGRCKIYELLFVQAGRPNDSLDNLICNLLALYTEILRFLAKANRVYSRNTSARAFLAIFDMSTIQSFGTKCQEWTVRLEAEAGNCERIYSHQANDGLQSQLAYLQNALATFDDPILRTDSKVAELWNRSEQSERNKILFWSSDLPYEELHRAAKENKAEKTAIWLLERESYREWRDSSASTFLWLHGIPGAGKTTLVSSVVDDLLETFNAWPNNEGLAYFYCNRSSGRRRDLLSILRSFVRQLSVDRTGDAMQPALIKLYNAKAKMSFPSDGLGVGECQTLLREYTDLYPQTTLVLDALDECEESTQIKLIKVLDDIVNRSSRVVKCFIASRPYEKIRQRFDTGPNIGIKATDNGKDIAIFVEMALKEAAESRPKLWSQEIQQKVTQTLLERSSGMFQWAVLQISQLLKLRLQADILERLGRLPPDLEKAYDEIFRQIDSQQPRVSGISKRLFSWMMIHQDDWIHPDPKVMLALACQDPETDTLEATKDELEFVLDVCESLVVFNHQRETYHFAHLSVLEYLESHGFTKERGYDLAARVCLRLLMCEEFNDRQFRKSIMCTSKAQSERRIVYEWRIRDSHAQRCVGDQSPDGCCGGGEGNDEADEDGHEDEDEEENSDHGELQDHGEHRYKDENEYLIRKVFAYAVVHWFRHAQACEESGGHHDPSPELVSLMMRFLGSLDEGSRYYRTWVAMLHHRGWDHYDLQVFVPPYNAASLSACKFGLYRTIAPAWLPTSVDVRQQTVNGTSLLTLAADSGNTLLCQRLIQLGADVNCKVGERDLVASPTENLLGSPALISASRQGNDAIIELLIKNGATTNTADPTTASALQLAAGKSQLSTIRLLLDAGAEVDTSKGGVGCPLSEAAGCGKTSVVELLLDRGADVNKVSYQPPWTALQAAAQGSKADVAELLLRRGADVDYIEGCHMTALQWAAAYSGFEIVQLLIQKGADVNLVGSQRRTALHLALYRFDQETGLEEVVRLLLKHGADINVEARHLGPPLHTAAAYANHRLVQLILNKGANVNFRGGRYYTALQAAARGPDSEAIVKILLASGADVKPKGGWHGTALNAALENGRVAAARLLRDAGAIDYTTAELARYSKRA